MRQRFDSRPLVLRRQYTATMRHTVVVEWPTQARHGLHLFFVICSSVVARNVASQQALDAWGPAVLSKLYMTFPLAAGLGVLLAGWLARNTEPRRFARLAQGVSAVVMALAFLAPAKLKYLAFAKYVALEIAFAVMLLAFGLVLGAALGPREARQAAGRVGAGGILGGLLAGAILILGAKFLGSRTLYLVSAGFAVLPVFFIPQVTSATARARLGRGGFGPDHADVPALAGYGRWVAVTTFLMATATTFIDYQFRFRVDQSYHSDDMTAFFGLVVFLGGIVTLIFQLTVLDRLLSSLGLFGTTMVMPATLLVCSAAFGVTPVLATLVVLKVTDSGANMSLQQATGSLLLAPLRPHARAVWQGRIDGIAKRGGQIFTGVALSLSALTPVQVVPVVVFLCALWMGSVAMTRGRYVRMLTEMLGAAGADKNKLEVYDGATLRLLETELASATRARAAVILDLLEQAGRRAPEHLLTRMIESDPDGPGATRVVEHLTSLNDVKSLIGLAQSQHTTVAAAALLALADLDAKVAQHHSRLVLANANVAEILRAMAAGILAERDPQALALSQRLACAPDSGTRMASAQALGRLSLGAPPEIHEILGALANDPDPEIARTAITSLGQHPTTAGCEIVLAALDRHDLRGTAMRALATMGAPVVKRLSDELAQRKLDAKIAPALTWAIGRIGAAAGIPALVEVLDSPTVQIRLNAAVALSAMFRRAPDLDLPFERINARIKPEIAYYARIREASLMPMPQTPAGTLLLRALKQRAQASLETLFRILALRYTEDAMQGAFQAISSREPRRRQIALELLDNLLDKDISQAIAEAVGGERLKRRQRRETTAGLAILARDRDRFLVSLATAVQFDLAQASGEQRREAENTGIIMAQTLVQQILELQSLALFSHSSAEDLAEVASLVSARRVTKDAVLFREGDTPDAMYLVRKGEVTISCNGKLVDHVGPGEACGVIAVLDQLPRESTATASMETSLLMLRGDDLLQLLADRPLLMHSLFRALTGVVRAHLERGGLGKKGGDWSW